MDSLYNTVSFRAEGLDSYIKSHGEGFKSTLEEVVNKSFYPNVARFFSAPVTRDATGAVVPMTNMLEKKGTDEYTELKGKFDAEVFAEDAAQRIFK